MPGWTERYYPHFANLCTLVAILTKRRSMKTRNSNLKNWTEDLCIYQFLVTLKKV